MGERFACVLESCPEAARPAAAAALARLFSLKDTTTSAVLESLPIVLLTELSLEEAAVVWLQAEAIRRAGAVVQMRTPPPGDDLPKIDWPKRPQLYRRDLDELVADLKATPGAQGSFSVSDFIIAGLTGQATKSAARISSATLQPPPVATPAAALNPPSTPFPPTQTQTPRPQTQSLSARPKGRTGEFTGTALPEVTPFATAALSAPSAHGDGDAKSRLDQLFPDDHPEQPKNEDINSVLDKMLPDDEGDRPGSSSSGRAAAIQVAGDHSVFLAKITDEGKRAKAVPLIAELAKVTTEEAEVLSKKMIIPILKNVSKDDAESAKQKFAKIGLLTRVKGPEG